MPNYNDLQELKEKIQSIGNEPEILEKKELPVNDTPLPEETVKENNIQEETEDLMSDILEDFEKGNFISDDETEEKGEAGKEIETSDLDSILGESEPEISDTTSDEESIGDEELNELLGESKPGGDVEEEIDTSDLDALLEGEASSESKPSEESAEDLSKIIEEPSEEAPIEETKIDVDDLGDLLGEAPAELPAEEKEKTKADTEELADLLDGVDIGESTEEETTTQEAPLKEAVGEEELDSLMTGLGEEIEEGMQEEVDEIENIAAEAPEETKAGEEKEIEADVSNLDALIGDIEDEKTTGEDTIEEAVKSEETADTELSDLSGDIGEVPEETLIPSDELNDLLGDTPKEAETGEEEKIDEDTGGLDALIGDFEPDIVEESGGVKETLPSEEDMLTDMAGGMGEETEAKVQDGIEGDDVLEQLGQESEPLKDLQDLDSLLGEDTSMKSMEEGIGETEISEAPPQEDLIGEEESAFDALQDISALETKESEISDESQGKGDDFETLDFDKLDSLGTGEIGGPSEEIIEVEPSVKDSSFGEIPEEISEEDIKKDKDVEINLTDDERKQVVISLRGLPKEAELKISKAIISNKYSNSKLKPLVNALIENESPQVIIRYYEKITGDKSLSQLEAVKHAGVKFEEKQKTFAYVFQKNILPILSKIMAALTVVFLLVLFAVIIVRPRVIAAIKYKEGKELIEQKNFIEGQNKFDEAFKIHQKYSQVVDYARKYREYKRYLASEKMYDLAVSMKPNKKNIVLEFADMFRENKNFERAESKYKGFLIANEKDVDALLGLAKTYYDWSEEEAEKLDDAKETYLDVLEIDRNNKEAVFGNLNIHIKEDNYTDVIKHYNYIESKFGKKIDPETYSRLAEYLIDAGNVENVKNIINKASNALKKGQFLPELEYQNARYNKLLNIYPEERMHLMNALTQIEDMKKSDPGKFGSTRYQKLLSRVYNDLGENFEITSKVSTDAERYYKQAIITDSSFGKAYYNLANFALYNKPNGYLEAKEYYLDAEERGFTNDRLNYNLSWLYYREKDYYNSYKRIATIFEKEPDNSNLKFMTGTIFYKLGRYELSESMLLETYLHFQNLSDQFYPLDPDEKEGKIILEMIEKVSNNLGATYQKRFEETKNSKYLISATKYYQDSIMAFDKVINRDDSEIDINFDISAPQEGEYTKYRKENAHINLRMVLYPDAGLTDPILYEDFPLDYSTYM